MGLTRGAVETVITLKNLLDKHKPHGMGGNLASLFEGHYMVQSEWLESHESTPYADAENKLEEWKRSFEKAGLAKDMWPPAIRKPSDGRGYIFCTCIPQDQTDALLAKP